MSTSRLFLSLVIILITTITYSQSKGYDTWIRMDKKFIKGNLLDTRNDSVLFIVHEEVFYKPNIIIPVEEIDYIKQRKKIRNREGKTFLGIFLGAATGVGGGALMPASAGQFYSSDFERVINMTVGGLLGALIGGVIGATSSNPMFNYNIDKSKSNFEKHKDRIQFYY